MSVGILSVLEEIKVNQVLIGKQFEQNSNYEKFKQIVREKNIKVKTLVAGQKVKLSKTTYIEVIWPEDKTSIEENSINNNALVFKFCAPQTSILFTGDIEEEAEEQIIEKYKNKLKSKILKVAHHGSSGSSTKEFIELVSPKIALIGVGKDNKYGHPGESTINLLKNISCNVYRTDLNGEISIINNQITTKISND